MEPSKEYRKDDIDPVLTPPTISSEIVKDSWHDIDQIDFLNFNSEAEIKIVILLHYRQIDDNKLNVK